MLSVAVLMTVRSHRERALQGLEECIRQMDRLVEGGLYTYRIFLNDDASSDGIAEDIRERFPDVTIIKSPGDRSWGGGIRTAWLGAAEAGHWDFYLWLDYDLELRENALSELFDTSSMLRHRAILAGTATDAEGNLLAGGRSADGRLLQPDGMIPLPCHTFDGVLVLVPAAVFDAIGPLDERYRHALAANDYGIRARKAGFPRMVTAGVSGIASRRLPVSDDKEEFHYNSRAYGFFHALRTRFRKKSNG